MVQQVVQSIRKGCGHPPPVFGGIGMHLRMHLRAADGGGIVASMRRAAMGFLRKTKSEKENDALRRGVKGEPNYESLRIVRGFYIEKDLQSAIDAINKSGILKWFSQSSRQSEKDADKPHRSSEDPE